MIIISRKSFTLIELVFSIVVVGIAIMSIPVIIRNSNSNVIQSQNVLGYYNALTLMDTIKSKPWDTNNINDFEKAGIYYILYTGDANQDCYLDTTSGNTTNYIKKGIGTSDRRRICDPNKKQASQIRPDKNLNSINAFNGYTKNINVGNQTIFNLEAKVEYVDINLKNGNIAPTTKITNVKKITVNLIKPNIGIGGSEVISSYIYYAANIGTDIPAFKDN